MRRTRMLVLTVLMVAAVLVGVTSTGEASVNDFCPSWREMHCIPFVCLDPGCTQCVICCYANECLSDCIYSQVYDCCQLDPSLWHC